MATTLILPARNDSWAVAAISKAHYFDMLAAGVRIFEFHGGLLHAKTMVADGCVTLIGSANMDRRSLELNYENNLLIADRTVVESVRARQLGYMSVSHAVDIETVKAWPYHQRLLQNAIGMMSPVL